MNIYTKSALLGIATALRTSAGPLAAHWISTGRLSTKTAVALGGEMVVDKLPFVGNRTGFPQLLGRAGAAIYAARIASNRTNAGALMVAAAAAVATSFAALRVRKVLADRLAWPQQVIGIAEDALVIGLVYGASKIPLQDP